MTEIKSFDPAALASLTTGILMVEFSAMAEVAEYIMGHGIFTHQYPSLEGKLKEKVLEQFPEMPSDLGGASWETIRDRVHEKYGKAVEVKKGNEEEISPFDTNYMPGSWLKS